MIQRAFNVLMLFFYRYWGSRADAINVVVDITPQPKIGSNVSL